MDEVQDGDRLAIFLDEERSLSGQLGELAPAARAALAAAVANRLLPDYWRFHQQTGRGEPLVLQSALEGVWARLERGSAIDIVPVGVACMDQASVAVDFGSSRAETPLPEAWRVANGAATPLVENAVHAAWAVAAACHVAVHGGALETLHCLRYGRASALASALSRRRGVIDVRSVRAAERDPLVERVTRRQLLDLKMLGSSGPTAQVLAKLRTLETDGETV